MSRSETVREILDVGVVAVVRSSDSAQLTQVVEALCDGGVRAAEITMTVPNAIDVIRDVCRNLGSKVILGAGTVLDPETARAVILAGARYVVAPTLNLEVIRMCHRYNVAIMPGALTPTEVLSAWENGADIVKLFPADLGGPGYFKALLAPLPQVRLMPTGGVNLETAEDFLRAGACCLGVGGSLVEKTAIQQRNWDRIGSLAEQYVEIVQRFRNG